MEGQGDGATLQASSQHVPEPVLPCLLDLRAAACAAAAAIPSPAKGDTDGLVAAWLDACSSFFDSDLVFPCLLDLRAAACAAAAAIPPPAKGDTDGLVAAWLDACSSF